jgi:c-di-GMP-binding flagellar brake protein YcgR
MKFLRNLFQKSTPNHGRKGLRVELNAPVALQIGEIYKTERALLRDLSLSGARFELSMQGPIPKLDYFYSLPFSFTLPRNQSIFSCTVDITRIYTTNEHEQAVYGMAVRFVNLSKEEQLRLEQYIQERAPQ